MSTGTDHIEAREAGRSRRRAPLSLLAAATALAFHAVAFTLYFSSHPLSMGISEAGLQFLTLLACMQLLSVTMYLTSSRPLFRILLLLRFAVLIALGYRFQTFFAARLALTTAVLVEVGLYEEFPSNVMIQAIAVALAVIVFEMSGINLLRSPQVVARALTFTLFAVAASLFTSLCTLFHERLIRSQLNESRLTHAVEALAETNTNLQDYAFQVESAARRDEQKRIAQQVHDSVGYTLTSLVMMMEAAADMVVTRPVEVEQLIETARDEASRCLDETRRALYALRSQPEDQISLTQAVHRLSKTFEKVTGTSITANYGNIPNSFGSRIDMALYRIIREALTNAFRHGRATRIEIYCWLRPGGVLDLRINDNGSGVDVVTEGMGLAGIRERLEEINGTLRAESRNGGFEVQVLLPVNGEERGKVSCNAG